MELTSQNLEHGWMIIKKCPLSPLRFNSLSKGDRNSEGATGVKNSFL